MSSTSKSLVVLAGLVLFAATAQAPAARPDSSGQTAPEAPETPRAPRAPRPARAPRPPRDHMIFFSNGGSWLGIGLADITTERAKALSMKEETGAEVTSVMPDSPAAEAGLKKGDVVLEYQETRIEGAMQLTRMVRETPPGRTVALLILRDGGNRTVKVKVTGREAEEHEGMFQKRIVIPPIEVPDIDMPDIPLLGSMPATLRLGVSIENLGDQLGEYFGVKGGEGVLVRSVKKGSPADGAGLRAGDVIVKADGEKISDSGDLRSALREARGRTFPLGIVRDRREQSVTVTLPKPETPPPDEEDDEDSSYMNLLEGHDPGSAHFDEIIRERVRKKMDEAMRRLESKQIVVIKDEV